MMSEENDQMSAFSYKLVCTYCSFETTVEGSFLDALDIADNHQEERGAQPSDHFVNVEQYGHQSQESHNE